MQGIIPSAAERQETHERLKILPENESLYKCHMCRYIFDIYSDVLPIFMALAPKDNIRCPKCGVENVELMCKIDGYSIYLKLSGKVKCRQGVVINGTDICPVCKSSMCPECFNHNCVSLSRVTGYIQDTSGWNIAKKQELIDRKRYEVPNILA